MWSLFTRQTRPAQPARRPPAPFRPRLEALEDRYLLSAGALDQWQALWQEVEALRQRATGPPKPTKPGGP
jgi:hypothetical protein